VDSALSSPLTLDLYVDNFVYFSEDPATKHKFKTLLSTLATVEFMGTVEWFLGTHFQWLATDNIFSVHLSQTGFAAHLIKITTFTRVTSPMMPHPTVQASQSTSFPNQMNPTIVLPSLNESASIRASSDQSVGWLKALAPIWRQHIPSFWHTVINPHVAIGMLHYMHCITFTPNATIDLCLLRITARHSILLCPFLRPPTRKPTPTHCRLDLISIID
jgi:hypothetical protein